MRTEFHTAIVGVLFGLLLSMPTASKAGHDDVAVRVGGNAEVDACRSWAVVAGLNPAGDGFLAVRAGPGTRYRRLDKLTEARGFYVCSDSSDGQWVGIVYPKPGQENGECGVSGAMPKAQAYRGPCASGWVNATWVRVLAG